MVVPEAKRHHVVPEFYLRRFAAGGNVELVLRNDLTKAIPSSVENALVQRYFYAIDTESGRDTTLETMFANDVEYPAARAIERVVDMRKASTLPRLRAAISNFLALQFVRGAATREAQVEFFKANARKIATTATPEILQAELRRQGKPVSGKEARAIVSFARTGDYKVQLSSEANAHLEGALHVAAELVPMLAQRKWVLLDFDEPALLTGDEPVALVGDSLEPGEVVGAARAPQIVFPMDPKHALIMVRADLAATDGRWGGTPAMATILNRHVAFNCHRFLVRYPGSVPLDGLDLPEKANSVLTTGHHVIVQPRVSKTARAEWLRQFKARHT